MAMKHSLVRDEATNTTHRSLTEELVSGRGFTAFFMQNVAKQDTLSRKNVPNRTFFYNFAVEFKKLGL